MSAISLGDGSSSSQSRGREEPEPDSSLLRDAPLVPFCFGLFLASQRPLILWHKDVRLLVLDRACFLFLLFSFLLGGLAVWLRAQENQANILVKVELVQLNVAVMDH